jgi:hypothetical protein
VGGANRTIRLLYRNLVSRLQGGLFPAKEIIQRVLRVNVNVYRPSLGSLHEVKPSTAGYLRHGPVTSLAQNTCKDHGL